MVHVTGWPAATVMLAGEKANLLIETAAAAADAGAAAAVGAGALSSGRGWAAAGWARLGCAAGPGCSTILRGALPTGMVSATRPAVTSTSETSFEFSLLT